MIAASIMLGHPIIPHHKRSRSSFHPHLISRVVYAAIEMANHVIGPIGCQLVNRFGKSRIHKRGFSARHRTFLQNRLFGGFFPIDSVSKLGRVVILAVFIDKGKPSSSHRLCRYLWLFTVILLLCRRAHNKPV